jgi:cysteine desulfurase
MVYLDHNATTPLDPAVRAEMDACLDASVGNPGSLHASGQKARSILDHARRQAARLIGAQPGEIVFTSGGTESDNLAIIGTARTDPQRTGIVTTMLEHHAVLNACHYLETQGHEVTWARADQQGRFSSGHVAEAIDERTAVVSVMLANNETGVIQPVGRLGRTVRDAGAVLHTDAVQAVGRIPVDVNALGVDLLSFSGHKINGPKGVGVLYVRSKTCISPILFGGRQERTLRPGTENVPAIAGLGKACELAAERLAEDSARIGAMRDAFEAVIASRLPGITVNGSETLRLPNTSSIIFPGIDSHELTTKLDELGIAVSTGSACSAASSEPSHVVLAMGRSLEDARSTVRFSFGRTNTDHETARAIEGVCQAVAALGGCR